MFCTYVYTNLRLDVFVQRSALFVYVEMLLSAATSNLVRVPATEASETSATSCEIEPAGRSMEYITTDIR